MAHQNIGLVIKQLNCDTKPGITSEGRLGTLRWFQLLLISLLMLGQVHLCEGSYQLPNGQTCFACPELDEKSCGDLKDRTPSLQALHGDCHDCCVLAACEDKSPESPTLAPGWAALDIVACLPPKLEILIPCGVLVGPKPIHIASAPITGPPSQKSSRAPPFSDEPVAVRWTQFVIA